jgi:hypothetical protein
MDFARLLVRDLHSRQRAAIGDCRAPLVDDLQVGRTGSLGARDLLDRRLARVRGGGGDGRVERAEPEDQHHGGGAVHGA